TAPLRLHAGAKTMLIDTPPIARTVRRLTHSILTEGRETYISPGDASRLTFPHAGRRFGPALALRPTPISSPLMELSAKDTWKRLLEEARRELPEATVRTWLEPAVPLALEDGRLVLGVPDQFAAEWNDTKHAPLLARAAERVFGAPTPVAFRVLEDRQQ